MSDRGVDWAREAIKRQQRCRVYGISDEQMVQGLFELDTEGRRSDIDDTGGHLRCALYA